MKIKIFKIEFMCQEKELKFLKSQRISIPIILQNISKFSKINQKFLIN